MLHSSWPAWTFRSLPLVLGIALTCGMLALAPATFSSYAYAAPSEDDIAAAKDAETKTQDSISGVEKQIGELATLSTQLTQEAADAQAAFDEAAAAADKAKTEAVRAREQADRAVSDVDEARSDMASVAQAIYRNSAANLSGAYYVMSVNSLAVASERNRAYSLVASHTDEKVQSFEALENTARSLKKRAEEKEASLKKALTAADQAAEAAAQAAAAAGEQMAQANAQRADLQALLADQQATTSKLVNERAAAVEAERRAREEAAAQAAAQAAAAAQEAAGNQHNTPTPAPQPSTSTAIDPSKPVIDISQWQDPSRINYDALASSVSGVILRIGYTGSYTGNSYYKDNAFEHHYAEFTRRGVPVGIYWYSGANSGNEGAAEAQAALRFLGGRSISMPIYIDVEDPTQQLGASMATLTDQSLKFAATIRAGGYRPGIYSSSSWYYSKLNLAALRANSLSIWVAQWSAAAPSIGGFDMWQYSSTGRLPGYSGALDMNVRS